MTDDSIPDDPIPDDPARSHGPPDGLPHPAHPAAGDDLDDTIGGLLDELDSDDELDVDDGADPDDDAELAALDDPDPDPDDAETGVHAGGIDLDVDHDLDDDSDDDDDQDDPARDAEPGEISLDVVEDAVEGYDTDTLASLAALGGVEPGVLEATIAELGLDEAADARSAVVALEHLGVDAMVAFGDVDQLADLLERGGTIHLGNAQLVGLDDHRDEAVVVLADGSTARIALDDLEQRWAEHGYELVIGADGRAVLPITAGTDDGGVPG